MYIITINERTVASFVGSWADAVEAADRAVLEQGPGAVVRVYDGAVVTYVARTVPGYDD